MCMWRRRCGAGADWTAFREHVAVAAAQLSPGDLSAEGLQTEFDRVVTEAAETCLRREAVQRARRQQWWSDERGVRQARKQYQRARRRTMVGPALTPEVARR